jgi:hypothetical protein
MKLTDAAGLRATNEWAESKIRVRNFTEIGPSNLLWVVGDSTINEIPRNFGLLQAWLIALNHTKLET